MKCIDCGNKTNKLKGYEVNTYECKKCGEIFDEYDISDVTTSKGKKSREKQKFTKSNRLD